MKFSEAVQLLEAGKKVRVVSWPKTEYIYSNKEFDELTDEKGVAFELASLSQEWEEYVEPQKYFDLEKACYYLKLGYLIKARHWQKTNFVVINSLTEKLTTSNELTTTTLDWCSEYHICDNNGEYIPEPPQS